MDLQHRLVRQAIDIAVGKALDDAKGNIKRSLRNLVDLGLLFSKNDAHRRLFLSARKAIANPKNTYIPIVKRIISEVDYDTFKKVGVNLGYNSWIYGVSKLIKKQQESGERLPWLLLFDLTESSPAFYDWLKRLFTESRGMGIFTFICRLHQQEDIVALCEMANCFDECVFIVKTPAALISEQTASIFGQTHNLIISVQAVDHHFSSASDINAFQLLKRNRCLYGYHLYYSEKNMNRVTSSDCVRTAIGFGNLFGVYIARDGVSKQCRDTVYDFIYRERDENGELLITLEWFRDIQYISDKITHGLDYMTVDLVKRAYFETRCRESLPHSLLEILYEMYLCTSSGLWIVLQSWNPDINYG
ncbi:MAG: hypothetical protein FNP40_04285 [Dehalobacter sp. 4CP]|nr:hypothetical protein [Dehalobacter sp. 4CP]